MLGARGGERLGVEAQAARGAETPLAERREHTDGVLDVLVTVRRRECVDGAQRKPWAAWVACAVPVCGGSGEG